MRVPPSKLACTAAALALGLLGAGCGSSSSTAADSAIQPAPSSPSPATTAPTASTATPTTPANPALAKKPTIAKPSGPAPTKLVVRDLVKGAGPPVKAGQMLTVQYVGVLYKTGKQFDSSWDKGQPLPLTLGTGGVIRGWDMGLVGMRVGGRRQLIIPAALAYGARGQGTIPPNAPLIFDIDLLSAQ